jgi:hypothetical protein
VTWLEWHGTSAITGISHLVEGETTPNESGTGGITIELLDDSDEEDDQLGRENATPETIAQPPAGRIESPAGREEPPAGREEPSTGRNEECVAREMRKLDTFYDPTENATETVLQVSMSMSSDPGTPCNDKEAGTCEERELWDEGRAKEYENFSIREAWKHVDRGSLAPQPKDLGNQERLQSEARSRDRCFAVQSSQCRERLHTRTRHRLR